MGDLPPPNLPPPGWYVDPEGQAGQRYWDGQRWTDQRRQTQEVAPPPSPSAEGQVIYVERAGNGLAVAALVCGIVGLILGLVPILFAVAWALGVVALVLGIIARRRAVRRPEVGRKTMSTAAIVLGVLSIGIGIVGYAIVNDAFEDVEEATEELDRDVEEATEELDRELRDLENPRIGAVNRNPGGPGNAATASLPAMRPYIPNDPSFFYLAEIPSGGGWSAPVESNPTEGALLRTTVRGPGGQVLIVDRTPDEIPQLGGGYDSSDVVSHPRFGSATKYVFSNSEAIPECSGSTCVDYLIEDKPEGVGECWEGDRISRSRMRSPEPSPARSPMGIRDKSCRGVTPSRWPGKGRAGSPAAR